LTDRIAGFSMERLRQNVTLVNSNWTGAQVKKFLGIQAETLYPPLLDGPLRHEGARNCGNLQGVKCASSWYSDRWVRPAEATPSRRGSFMRWPDDTTWPP
jgi:hypothetical protein